MKKGILENTSVLGTKKSVVVSSDREEIIGNIARDNLLALQLKELKDAKVDRFACTIESAVDKPTGKVTLTLKNVEEAVISTTTFDLDTEHIITSVSLVHDTILNKWFLRFWKQGGAYFDCDITSLVADYDAKIAAEKQERIAADAALQANINTEAGTRAAADTTLQTNINNEAIARANADTAETQARIAADTGLASDINTLQAAVGTINSKIPAAASATNQLADKAWVTETGGKVNDVKVNGTSVVVNKVANIDLTSYAKETYVDTKVAAEKTRAETAEAGLQAAVDSKASQDDLDAETTARTNADNNLQNNIDDEATARSTADTTLQSNIDAEAATRASKDTELEESIAAEETRATGAESTLNTAITSEAQTRSQADTSLGGRIDTEASARTAADTALQANITAETNRATGAETTLQDNITAEATTRASEDTRVAGLVSTEETRAKGVESGLDTRIQNLEARGRFLSGWNSNTGKPTTEPTTPLPYAYKAGDYYLVEIVDTGTKYQPDGASYTGEASTVVETREVAVGDYYTFDSTRWIWISNSSKTTTFSQIAGAARDNTSLKTELETLESADTILGGRIDTEASTRAAADAELTTQVGTKVDKTSTANKIYGTDNTGAQTTYDKDSFGKVDDVKLNGTSVVSDKVANITNDEYTTKLKEDLYAYTNIGKITASKTNPVKVADAGDPLKDVFNAILGTEEDTNPTINTAGTTFTKSGQTGTTTESGGEIGKTINAQTGTITFTVTNTATCTYGLKTASADTYSKTAPTTFNYPIKVRTVTVDAVEYSYQIAISYPELNGCTLSITAGTLVKDDTANRKLYCNVDTNKKVTLSVSIPAGSSTSSNQTRFGTVTANVEFTAPTYNNVLVDNFWTYLKNSYTASGLTPPAQKSANSTAYTITNGSYYTYYKVTDDTTHVSTGWTAVGSNTVTDITIVANAGQYVWLATTQNKTNIYEWNDVSGKYNTDPTDTTKTSGQTIHTTTGLDVSSYYTYRTPQRSGATNKKFKLV